MLLNGAVLLITLLVLQALFPFGVKLTNAKVQPGCKAFAETGKSVCGRFLQYWTDNGGLAQQGFPISDEMQETSFTDGKTYTVQYFERALFENHPENSPPYDVLLALLGESQFKKKYPQIPTGQKANKTGTYQIFPETGYTIGGDFFLYWQSHGGLPQQGYPISDEFQEKSDLDGKTYTVQYFERAVFEMHPENQPPYNVLLSQLGTYQYRERYGGEATPPSATPSTAPSPVVATPTVGPRAPTPTPSDGYPASVAPPNRAQSLKPK